MLVDVLDHLGPVGTLIMINGPAHLFHVCSRLRQDSGVMHHLLRDAAHIHACATETPLGANWGRLHEVGKSDLLAQMGGADGARNTATATADHKDVVLVGGLRRLVHLHCCSSLDHLQSIIFTIIVS